MTAPKPLTGWQETLPVELPLHVRRNIAPGDGGCWLWRRSRGHDGYGWASFQDKTHQAHRLVYRLVIGEVPDGLVLDHLCRVRHCVNPDHLEAVTPRENLVRSPITPAGMTLCAKGHELVEWHGQRRCLECKREYQRAYDHTRRAGLIADDARVVDLHATKVYGDQLGAHVIVKAI